MSDIEQKALALISDVQREEPKMGNHSACYNALCRAIEQHEAFKQELSNFRQEVSDAIEAYKADQPHIWKQSAAGYFCHLIIPATKPDPLVEVLKETYGASLVDADELRAALEARGLEIRSKNDD